MKAVFRDRYCEPVELQIKQVQKPVLAKDTDVLVQVKACTINRTDLGVQRGKPYIMRLFTGLLKPSNPITGTDFSGVVVETGAAVKDVCPGDLVWGFKDTGCASHAEFMLLKHGTAYKKLPPGSDIVKIVACAEAAHYARNFLNCVKLENGMQVLVNGGSGAIGSALIQLIKAENKNIEVYTTCKANMFEAVTKLGADNCIDYEKFDFTSMNRRFDVVFDAVGKSTFSKCKAVLKPKGVYLSSELGPYWQNVYLPWFNRFRAGKKIIFPIPVNIHKSLEELQELFLKGKFNPLIDRVIPFDDAPDAFVYVHSGVKNGNVVVTLNS